MLITLATDFVIVVGGVVKGGGKYLNKNTHFSLLFQVAPLL